MVRLEGSQSNWKMLAKIDEGFTLCQLPLFIIQLITLFIPSLAESSPVVWILRKIINDFEIFLLIYSYLFKKGVANHFDNIKLRPRNINWQDWKYTSFVVFVGYSQNIRRHNAMCRDELVADVIKIIGLKLQFSSWFSIHFLLHRLYRFNYHINSIYECVIIEFNVLHRFVSLSCKNFLFSVCTQKWIEAQLWKGNLNPMFPTTSATS